MNLRPEEYGGWEPKTLLDVLIHLEWEWEWEWDCDAWWPKGNSLIDLFKSKWDDDDVVRLSIALHSITAGDEKYLIDGDQLIDRLLQIGKGE